MWLRAGVQCGYASHLDAGVDVAILDGFHSVMGDRLLLGPVGKGVERRSAVEGQWGMEGAKKGHGRAVEGQGPWKGRGRAVDGSTASSDQRWWRPCSRRQARLRDS